MKKLLLVIVLLLVAVVSISSMTVSDLNEVPDRAQTSSLGFEDASNTEIAPIAGPVHP